MAVPIVALGRAIVPYNPIGKHCQNCSRIRDRSRVLSASNDTGVLRCSYTCSKFAEVTQVVKCTSTSSEDQMVSAQLITQSTPLVLLVLLVLVSGGRPPSRQ